MAREDQKIERLTDLILVLLDASQPIPLNTLAEEIPGYPPAGEARRMAFERDKRLLREEGIIVESVQIDGAEQYGYRIDQKTYFLPNLDLTPEEQAALHLAVAGVHLPDDSGGDALRKLGVMELADAQPVASLGTVAGLDRIFQALSTSAELRFRYRGEDRIVYPVRLRFSGGHWYLAGWAKERAAGRVFRVDRIEGVIKIGAAGTGALDDSMTVSLDAPDEPWVDGDSPTPITTLQLLADQTYAWRLIADVGHDAVRERKQDGSVILEVEVGRTEAARSWVLSFLDHVEVLGPQSFRDELIDWLDAIVDVARTEVDDVSLTDLEQGSDGTTRNDDASVPPTQRRLRRLLAMLEWLAGVGTASTQEVADRFEMTPEEVVAELELAACCGRPPFSPGELMDIIVDADQVSASLPEMNRPRQFTPAEGVALAAAARTILALPGADIDGPLGRALAKLDAALGQHRALEVAIDSPTYLEAVSSAANEKRILEVEYWTTSTDELTTRTIEPLRVYSLEGRWYVEAWCHRAEATRTFRVDQLKSVRDIGEQSEDRTVSIEVPSSFVPAADAEVTIIEVGPGARWMADSIPVLARRSAGEDGVVIALSVSGPAWFERIMLQAGPDAVVVGPEPQLSVAKDAALRVLSRYRPTV